MLTPRDELLLGCYLLRRCFLFAIAGVRTHTAGFPFAWWAWHVRIVGDVVVCGKCLGIIKMATDRMIHHVHEYLENLGAASRRDLQFRDFRPPQGHVSSKLTLTYTVATCNLTDDITLRDSDWSRDRERYVTQCHTNKTTMVTLTPLAPEQRATPFSAYWSAQKVTDATTSSV